MPNSSAALPVSQPYSPAGKCCAKIEQLEVADDAAEPDPKRPRLDGRLGQAGEERGRTEQGQRQGDERQPRPREPAIGRQSPAPEETDQRHQPGCLAECLQQEVGGHGTGGTGRIADLGIARLVEGRVGWIEAEQGQGQERHDRQEQQAERPSAEPAHPFADRSRLVEIEIGSGHARTL